MWVESVHSGPRATVLISCVSEEDSNEDVVARALISAGNHLYVAEGARLTRKDSVAVVTLDRKEA